jgi:hypothetical protein
MLPVTDDQAQPLAARLRHLLPPLVRRAGARFVAARRASDVEHQLAVLARDGRSIVVGPWIGEVGFELLYWIPFLRWFARRFAVTPERLIAVTRGGAAAWYAPFATRSYDVLAFMSQGEYRQRNADRAGRLGEQKQIASTSVDADIVARIRAREGDVLTLHPALMYRLFAPYWWGHKTTSWVRAYTEFARMEPPRIAATLPQHYTAVKFYFNDCFADTPDNRAFVRRTISALAARGPVISLFTGVRVDDHDPCEPDVAAMQDIRHLLTPETNLLVQSAIVGRAERFVGTYGGFAYLAPLCGVPSVAYYTDPGGFSVRHLDLMREVLRADGHPEWLDVRDAAGGGV